MDTFVSDVSVMRSEGLEWSEIAEQLGMASGEAARCKFRRLKHQRPDPIEAANPEKVLAADLQAEDFAEACAIFVDRKVPHHADWRELLDLAAQVQRVDEAADDSQRFSTIAIDTDEPVAVMYSGDWHLGSRMDYATWAEDIKFLLNTPELFLVDLGDDYQNMRSFKDLSGVLSQTLSPKQQGLLIKSLIDELTDKNKLLAKVCGNHDDEFDERLFGSSVQTYLLERMQAPRFKNRGLIKLVVGKETYTNALYHKSRFSSFMRPAHGSYREYGEFFPADVVAGAHDHKPGYEEIWHYEFARENGFNFGGKSMLIKVGSPQQSNFGWKYFHGGGYLAPTVVYFPKCHKFLAFNDARDAVAYIHAIKGQL